MYREMIYIGIGIYLIILAVGFTVLSTVRKKQPKPDKKKEIIKEILTDSSDTKNDENTINTANTIEVREAVKVSEKETGASSSKKETEWTSLLEETEILENETEILHKTDDIEETEILQDDIESTELLEDKKSN